MNFSNKNILVLTDGSDGMISQVMGLAKQLSLRINSINTKILFPWSNLQPGILPVYSWIFKNSLDISPKPDIIISCGRKSVYLSIYLKKKYLRIQKQYIYKIQKLTLKNLITLWPLIMMVYVEIM